MPSLQQIVWSIGCHDRAYVNDRLDQFLYPNTSLYPNTFSALLDISIGSVFVLAPVDGNVQCGATVFFFKKTF